MRDAIRVLVVEDNAADAAALEIIASGSLAMTHVTTLKEGLGRLAAGPFDAVLLDLNLPDSTGLGTVQRMVGAAPQQAVVVLTGVDDSETGTEAVKLGAQDYLVKGQIVGTGLLRAVSYAIERKRAQQERERLVTELQQALAEVKRLGGLLPICASCKKIRNDQGYWQQVEEYISERTDADFTHGVCPECVEKFWQKWGKK